MKASRILSLVFGLLLCVFLLARGISQEVPVGKLHGIVLMAENGKPIKGAIISITSIGTEEDANYHRTFVADKDGVFSAQQLPAGAYSVSASAKAHNLESSMFVVEEGQRKDLELQLDPVEPFMDLYASQHVFTPEEKPSIELHGFAPVDEIEVKVYKIDSAKIIAAGQLESVLSPLQTYEYSSRVPKDPTTVGKLIFDTPHKIRNKDLEGVFVESLETPKLDEGIYWIKTKANNLVRNTYLNITRMALVTKMVGRNVLCYTTRIDTGEPISGVKVGYTDGKGFVPMATTDANGTARYQMKASKTVEDEEEDSEDSGGNQSAIAVWGNSFALTSSYIYGGNQDATKMYVYTDRPVYRPGDNVQFKGIVRKVVGKEYGLSTVKEVQVEYRTPDDSLLKSETLTVSPSGAFVGNFTVSKESETGGYSIVAKAPGYKYTKYVPIQAYRKPQFNVEIKSDKKYFVRGEKASATLKCSYYFGGPVIGAKVYCYINKSPVWGDFNDAGGDGSEGGEYVESMDLTTDERGEAKIEFDTVGKDDEKRAEQDYVYSIEASVEDEGNQTFDASGEVKVARGDYDVQVSSSSYIAGVNQPLKVTILAQSHDDKPQKGVDVQVTTYFSEWQDDKEIKVDPKESSVRTNDKGEAEISVTPNRSGSLRIEALSRDSHGNEIVSTEYVWVEGGPVSSFDPETPKLSVKFDKDKYKVGDTAKVLIETSMPGGTALMTLEADGIYFTKTIELKQNVTVAEVPITSDCSPNVWASVCYVRKKTFNEASEGVDVEATEKNLDVSVQADKKVYLPGDTVKLSVQTKNDKGQGVPSEVSVGVVDEGIYAILEDQTDIHEAFYPGRENSVTTAYSFPELYLDGGDKGAPDVKIRRDFRDTAYWNPVVQTDANGLAEVSVKLPDNLTEWRVTVVGATKDTAVGMNTAKFIARKPLMVRLSAPRFVVDGDEQKLVAQVTNDTGQDARVHVHIEADGISLDGDAKQEISIDNGGQESIEWTMKSAKSGTATLTAKAWIAGGASDGVELKVPVKPHGRMVQSLFAGDFKDKASFNFDLQPNADLNSTKLKLVLTPDAAYSLYQSLDELIDYPYGCVEQTMSRFLPCVVVSQLAKSGKLPHFAREKDIPKFVADGYSRLRKMHHSDGGWGWWETDESDPFMTAYVLEGMHIAANAGFKPNQFEVDKALKWAKAYFSKAKKLTSADAYLAYSLCLYDQKNDAAAVLGKVDASDEKALTSAYKVLAYRLLGPEYSSHLAEAKRTMMAAMSSNAATSWWTANQYHDEVNSRCLQALATVEPNSPVIAKVTRYLMLQRKGDMWDSTRGTAFAILGLAKTLTQSAPVPPGSKIDVRINGKVVQTIELSEAALQINGLKADIPTSGLKQGSNSVEIVKNTPGTAYYSATFEQTVKRKQLGEVLSSSALRIKREYFLMEVQTLDNGKKKFMPSKKPVTEFRKGDVLKCIVTITSKEGHEFMIVEDPLPAGFKVTENVYYDPYEDWSYSFNAMDIRDDRVATFIRQLETGQTEISYMMRAESPGKAIALPAVTYNMYDTAVRASSNEIELEVRE